MNLDHDDFLFDNNVFDTAYKSAKIGNFDITSSSSIAPNDKRIFDDIFFSEIIVDLGKKQFKKYSAIFLYLKVRLSTQKNNQYLKTH